MNNSLLINNTESDLFNSPELNEEQRSKEVLNWLVLKIEPLLNKSNQFIQETAKEQLSKFNINYDSLYEEDKSTQTALLEVDMQRIRNSVNRTSDFLNGYPLQDYDDQGPSFLVNTAIDATTSIMNTLNEQDEQIPTYKKLLSALESTKRYLSDK